MSDAPQLVLIELAVIVSDRLALQSTTLLSLPQFIPFSRGGLLRIPVAQRGWVCWVAVEKKLKDPK